MARVPEDPGIDYVSLIAGCVLLLLPVSYFTLDQEQMSRETLPQKSLPSRGALSSPVRVPADFRARVSPLLQRADEPTVYT